MGSVGRGLGISDVLLSAGANDVERGYWTVRSGKTGSAPRATVLSDFVSSSLPWAAGQHAACTFTYIMYVANTFLEEEEEEEVPRTH